MELGVFDLVGQQVAILASGALQAGTHTVYWDGRGIYGDQLASGVYLYRLRTADQVDARKLVLLK